MKIALPLLSLIFIGTLTAVASPDSRDDALYYQQQDSSSNLSNQIQQSISLSGDIIHADRKPAIVDVEVYPDQIDRRAQEMSLIQQTQQISDVITDPSPESEVE